MAVITYTFSLDATFKSVFITDDVSGTTTVEVRNKTTNALVASAPLSLWQAMLRNIGEWELLRGTDDLIAFTKV